MNELEKLSTAELLAELQKRRAENVKDSHFVKKAVKKEVELRKESAIKAIGEWSKNLKVEINQLEESNRNYLELINKLHYVENITLTRDRIVDNIKQKAAENPNPNPNPDDYDRNLPPPRLPHNDDNSSQSQQGIFSQLLKWVDEHKAVFLVLLLAFALIVYGVYKKNSKKVDRSENTVESDFLESGASDLVNEWKWLKQAIEFMHLVHRYTIEINPRRFFVEEEINFLLNNKWYYE